MGARTAPEALKRLGVRNGRGRVVCCVRRRKVIREWGIWRLGDCFLRSYDLRHTILYRYRGARPRAGGGDGGRGHRQKVLHRVQRAKYRASLGAALCTETERTATPGNLEYIYIYMNKVKTYIDRTIRKVKIEMVTPCNYVGILLVLGLYFPPGAAHGEARCPAAADAERRGVHGALLRPTAVRAV